MVTELVTCPAERHQGLLDDIVADGGNEQRTIAHVVAEGVTRKPGHARASSSARLAQELKLSASSRCSVNRATTRST